MSEEKLQMFRNRLTKMYRHVSKLARRQGVSCYRIYDHDLPEFPFCIERYEDKLYLAEYQRRHGMSEEEHVAWLESCVPTVSEILETPDEQIYFRERRRKAGEPSFSCSSSVSIGSSFATTRRLGRARPERAARATVAPAVGAHTPAAEARQQDLRIGDTLVQ